MLEIKVKKAILETKERKEKLLIEQNLVKKRIIMVFESENNIKKFSSLSKAKREKIAYKLVSEINYLKETNMLNEDLKDFMSKIFGNNLTSVFQTIVEPMVSSLVKSLDLADYFKDSLITSISSDPTRFSQSLRSCDELSKLVSESLSDAIHNRILQQTGSEGIETKFLNNVLADAVKDPKFSENIHQQISSKVCDLFDSMSEKASQIYDKLKPNVDGIGGILTP